MVNSSSIDLIVSGFPADFKQREFKNLFTFYTKLDSLELEVNNQGEKNFGKVSLKDIEEALHIKKILESLIFDEEGTTLKVELLKNVPKVDNKEEMKVDNKALSLTNSEINLAEKINDQNKRIENFLNNLISSQSPINKAEPVLYETNSFNPFSQSIFPNDPLNVTPLKTPPGLSNFTRNDRVQSSFDALLSNQFNSSFYHPSPFNSPVDAAFKQDSRFLPFSPFNDPLNSMMHTQNNIDRVNFDHCHSNEILANNDPSNNRLAGAKFQNIYSNRQSKPNYNADRNAPCNTLFIGNLLFGTLEHDIINLFKDVKGYQRLSLTYKINGNESTRDPDLTKQMENNLFHVKNMMQKHQNKDLHTLPGPICFVEFESTMDATNAITLKNGELLDIKILHDSNNPKAITSKNVRLSFSKNPFGVKPNPSLNEALNISSQKLSVTAVPFYPPQAKLSQIGQGIPSYTSVVTGNNHYCSNTATPLSSQFTY